MNLGNISIEARLRSPWQAIDLGFVMLRHWWKPLFLSWFIPSVLLFIPLCLIFHNSSWIAISIIWWLKPLWDRGPLYIASRNLFGEHVSTKQVLAKLLSLYKTDLLSALTIRRFSFSRSFDMPLTVLEKAKGKTRETRINQLHRSYGNAANWLTISCVHVEGFLMMAIYSFIVLMIPEQYSPDYLNLLVEERANTVFNLINGWVSYTAMILIGPIYSLCGFALYISRRIELEAWDIEIQFRKLAALHQEKKQRSTKGRSQKILGFLLCFSLALSFMSDTAIAQTEPLVKAEIEKNEDQIRVKNTIVEILEGDEFHTLKTIKSWRLKDFDPAESSNNGLPEWFINFISLMEKHGGFLSTLAEVIAYPFKYLEALLWILVIVLIAWLVYRYRQQIKTFISPNDSEDELVTIPDVMFGLDVRRESMPDDVPEAIQALWEAGDTRDAVSLLYRASLSELIHQYGFAFSESDTEGECLDLVKQQGESNLSDFTQQLTHCWQQLAYGHIEPETSDVETLCDRWKVVFSK